VRPGASRAGFGPGGGSPFVMPTMAANAAAVLIVHLPRIAGPNLTVANACTTGPNAVGEGARLIRDGTALRGGVRRHRSVRAILATPRGTRATDSLSR
jgi:3-oxoacyl-(acyl-carrier-protein) synthase